MRVHANRPAAIAEAGSRPRLKPHEATGRQPVRPSQPPQEIADALGLNLGFVTTVIGQILTKLGVDSRGGVTAYAFKWGIV